ncbi:SET domain-containing protein [Thozetella sp. PMI_491]|nr:SET domain-containing protein [Thozetella sp. PMI_491]
MNASIGGLTIIGATAPISAAHASSNHRLELEILAEKVKRLWKAEPKVVPKCYVVRKLVKRPTQTAIKAGLLRLKEAFADKPEKNATESILALGDSTKDLPTAPQPDPPPKPDSKRLYEPTEFLEIRPSRLGGLGVFALKKITAGQVVHVELPLLLTTPVSVWPDFLGLPEKDREKFMKLARTSMFQNFHDVERIRRANSFQVKGGGIAIFWVASRFNHACAPVRNVRYSVDKVEGICMWAEKDIAPGEEMLVSYGTCPDHLYRIFGFICTCGGCTPLTQDEVDLLEGRGPRSPMCVPMAGRKP